MSHLPRRYCILNRPMRCGLHRHLKSVESRSAVLVGVQSSQLGGPDRDKDAASVTTYPAIFLSCRETDGKRDENNDDFRW